MADSEVYRTLGEVLGAVVAAASPRNTMRGGWWAPDWSSWPVIMRAGRRHRGGRGMREPYRGRSYVR